LLAARLLQFYDFEADQTDKVAAAADMVRGWRGNEVLRYI